MKPVSAGASVQPPVRLLLDMRNASLYEIFSEIEKQGGYAFFYDNREIDDNLKVSVTAEDKTVSKILNEITDKAGLTYRLDGKHVYIAQR